jgi:hypothetical protein
MSAAWGRLLNLHPPCPARRLRFLHSLIVGKVKQRKYYPS